MERGNGVENHWISWNFRTGWTRASFWEDLIKGENSYDYLLADLRRYNTTGARHDTQRTIASHLSTQPY